MGTFSRYVLQKRQAQGAENPNSSALNPLAALAAAATSFFLPGIAATIPGLSAVPGVASTLEATSGLSAATSGLGALLSPSSGDAGRDIASGIQGGLSSYGGQVISGGLAEMNKAASDAAKLAQVKKQYIGALTKFGELTPLLGKQTAIAPQPTAGLQGINAGNASTTAIPKGLSAANIPQPILRAGLDATSQGVIPPANQPAADYISNAPTMASLDRYQAAKDAEDLRNAGIITPKPNEADVLRDKELRDWTLSTVEKPGFKKVWVDKNGKLLERWGKRHVGTYEYFLKAGNKVLPEGTKVGNKIVTMGDDGLLKLDKPAKAHITNISFGAKTDEKIAGLIGEASADVLTLETNPDGSFVDLDAAGTLYTKNRNNILKASAIYKKDPKNPYALSPAQVAIALKDLKTLFKQ